MTCPAMRSRDASACGRHQSCIVGITEIVDYVKPHPSKWYASGHWAFVLANARPLPFVQWKGALSIRDAPTDLIELLNDVHPLALAAD